MAKQLIRDAAGYINNRGKSKYWGVTTNENTNGKDFWVVSYTPSDKSQTITFFPVEFKLTEEEAATIAAFAYENGQGRHTLNGKAFPSSSNKYELRVRDTRITKHSLDVLPPAPAKVEKSGSYFDTINTLINRGFLSQSAKAALQNVMKYQPN